MSDNKQVQVAPEAPTTAAAIYNFAPTNLAEAMKLSEMLAASTIVPKDYIGKPGNCFIAMQMGNEIGLQPIQSLQGIAVINGKPSIYGDAGKALLLRAGCEIIEDDAETIKANKVARCTIKVPGRAPVTRTFSIADATAAGLIGKEGPWKNYRERQLAWRAFWFAARDGAADILKGLHGAEEARDMQEVAGEVVSTVRAPVQSKSEAAKAQPAATIDTTTGEVRAPAEEESTTYEPAVSPPAPAGMLKLIRAKAAGINVDEMTLCKKHQIVDTLDGINITQGNAILKSLAAGAEAYAA